MSQTNYDLVALVTGGNRGIGLATVERLAICYNNSAVLMGSRDNEEGQKRVSELRGRGLWVDSIWLDVTDDSSIAAAVELVQNRYGRLDVLINNAGMANDFKIGDSDVTFRALFKEQFDTNIFGAAQVTEAFIPLLKKSSLTRVVFVSSRLGSISQRLELTDQYYSVSNPIYRTSKAALNMLCAHYAATFGPLGWKVNAVDPGHVATRLNNFKGPDPVEHAVIQILAMATAEFDGPNGTFTNKEGVIGW